MAFDPYAFDRQLARDVEAHYGEDAPETNLVCQHCGEVLDDATPTITLPCPRLPNVTYLWAYCPTCDAKGEYANADIDPTEPEYRMSEVKWEDVVPDDDDMDTQHERFLERGY